MVKKYLTKVIEACENMPRCYPKCLALGKDICANISFKNIFMASIDSGPIMLMIIISRAANHA